MLKEVCLKKNIRIFIGRTDAEAPILWPPDAKSRLIGKDLHAGKVEGKRRNASHAHKLSNCGAGENSCESLGQQGDQTSQS